MAILYSTRPNSVPCPHRTPPSLPLYQQRSPHSPATNNLLRPHCHRGERSLCTLSDSRSPGGDGAGQARTAGPWIQGTETPSRLSPPGRAGPVPPLCPRTSVHGLPASAGRLGRGQSPPEPAQAGDGHSRSPFPGLRARPGGHRARHGLSPSSVPAALTGLGRVAVGRVGLDVDVLHARDAPAEQGAHGGHGQGGRPEGRRAAAAAPGPAPTAAARGTPGQRVHPPQDYNSRQPPRQRLQTAGRGAGGTYQWRGGGGDGVPTASPGARRELHREKALRREWELENGNRDGNGGMGMRIGMGMGMG